MSLFDDSSIAMRDRRSETSEMEDEEVDFNVCSSESKASRASSDRRASQQREGLRSSRVAHLLL